ncbi:MAG TPA: cysteine--tRNA ligase [Alphaproteobacteria bacterium]|nr:cysteine--tRNA ligase [Alphaproteobacteria bacterium]
MATTPKLNLFNTLSRKVEAFKPLNPADVRMYVCGITPYDDAHIGHARVYVVFDVLYRLLKHLYPKVTYVRNFTDIDDKIIQRATDNVEDPTALAQRFIESFHADMKALHVLQPTHEPCVSESIGDIVKFVDALLEKEFAYVTKSGDVMYHAEKFADFGKLARRDLSHEHHGARVHVDDEKLNPADFVLWKANVKSATKMEHAFAPAEYGAKHFDAPGRPGWHIECSAMSMKLLGERFDIHGGGEDLTFPHHSCEIAQTEALTGQPMATVWMHNSFITVDGTKMSKSLGNFTKIRDLIWDYEDDEPNWPADAVRLWLLQTHYRKPVDFSERALEAARQRSGNYYFENVNLPPVDPLNKALPDEFIAALCDDLNTAKALSILDKTEDNTLRHNMMEFLGVGSLAGWNKKAEPEALLPEQEKMLLQRGEARAAKDWKKSDELRGQLEEQGVLVEDHPDGTTTWKRK